MNRHYKRSALAVIAGALAAILAPPPPLAPSAWAREHMVVPDGPRAGEKLDLDLTPYIIEPLDLLGPDSPVNEIAVMKSGQTAFTTMLLAAIGHSIDRDPCRMMLTQPNDAALTEFNREKLEPVLTRSKPLAAKVRGQVSRSAQGSTTYSKKFPQGSLNLAIATSSSDLSGKTIKKVFNDEVDRYPDDVDGQGEPLALIEGRYLAFRASGDWKRADVSTPIRKGTSRIEKRYLGGDQRRWHVRCPSCHAPFVLTFDLARRGGEFRFAESFPYAAHYRTPCCQHRIEAHEKNALVREAHALQLQGLPYGWVPTAARPGAYPSYHFDVLSSPFVPWDDVAKAYLDSRGEPREEKGFVNLWLGLPYEEQTAEVSAPAIVAAAEDYPRDRVPARCGLTALAIDVNGDWAEWALHGFGPSVAGSGVDQWLVGTGQVEGNAKNPDDPLWARLHDLAVRRWPYAGGRAYAADLVGIDTGYASSEVYKFVRGRAGCRGLDGRPVKPGDPLRSLPLGTPKRIPAKDAYGRVLFKVLLYPVGSHELKSWLAQALAQLAEGRAAANALHLPREIVDEAYAEQLTSEVLVPVARRDRRSELRWVPRRGVRNEALDLAVYARALAFGTRPNGLGVDRLAPEQWAALIAERHGLDPAAPDLFGGPALPAAAPAAAAAKPVSLAERLARLNRGS